MKIAFQTKESISRKSHRKIIDFRCFSIGFHSNTFTDIILKGCNWIITKWRTQSHPCSWAIWHKSPLNIHCTLPQFWTHNNKVHDIYNIYNISRSYSYQALSQSPKSRNFADDIFICIKIFFIKNWGVLDSSFTRLFHWLNWQYIYGTIGLDNGLAPSKWEAIISANDDIVHWCVIGPQWVML